MNQGQTLILALYACFAGVLLLIGFVYKELRYSRSTPSAADHAGSKSRKQTERRQGERRKQDQNKRSVPASAGG
jgi:hypothetical protein